MATLAWYSPLLVSIALRWRNQTPVDWAPYPHELKMVKAYGRHYLIYQEWDFFLKYGQFIRISKQKKQTELSFIVSIGPLIWQPRELSKHMGWEQASVIRPFLALCYMLPIRQWNILPETAGSENKLYFYPQHPINMGGKPYTWGCRVAQNLPAG